MAPSHSGFWFCKTGTITWVRWAWMGVCVSEQNSKTGQNTIGSWTGSNNLRVKHGGHTPASDHESHEAPGAQVLLLVDTLKTFFVWIIFLLSARRLWKKCSHEIFTLKFSSCSILLAPIFPVKVEKSFELFFYARHSPPRFRTDPTEPWSYQKSRSGPWHSWYECQQW